MLPFCNILTCIKLEFVLKTIFNLFESSRFRQVLLYMAGLGFKIKTPLLLFIEFGVAGLQYVGCNPFWVVLLTPCWVIFHAFVFCCFFYKVGSRSGIWVQTNCKGDQQQTKVVTNKKRVNFQPARARLWKDCLYMGESSKFPNSWTFEIQILKLAVCLQNINISNFNG